MSTDHVEVIERELAGRKNFRNMKLAGASFRGKSLKQADFRNATLTGVDFSECDLTYANFEGANCYGANFTKAKCYRTNFKDANLSQTIMHATDFYGVTITLECKSFEGMDLLPGHWYAWLFYGLLMKPPTKDARDRLIEFLGAERYQVLRSSYTRRQL